MTQRLHAERMAQLERVQSALDSRAADAFMTLSKVTGIAEEAAASKVEVKDIIAGLNTNWDAIESRLQNIETALGWSRRGEP